MPSEDVRLSPLLDRALEELASKLRSLYGPALRDLRLFGSAARGEYREDSDVDVAVVLTEVDWKTRCEVIDLATDVGLAAGLLISPTVFALETWNRFRAEERPLVMDIEREGVRL